MKRQNGACAIMIFLTLFLSAGMLHAQIAPGQEPGQEPGQDLEDIDLPEFGFKAGLNYSNVWDEQGREFTAGSTYGFTGGFFLSIPVISLFGFQTEVLFSQKGYQRDGIFEGGDFIFSRTASYIDIPFQVQFRPAAFLSILAGPHYSVLIADDWEYNLDVSEPVPDELVGGDIRNNLLGLGAGVDLHPGRFIISARVGWDLLSNEGDGQTEEPRYKNRWLQFSAGYQF